MTSTVPEYIPSRPPHIPRRRWLAALVIFLLIAVPVGYLVLSGWQSQDSGDDKRRAASARTLVYEWPSKVQRRIYDVPIPSGASYVAHYETNSWDRSTMYVGFRATPEQLGAFLEELGARRSELAEGLVTIADEHADVVGWDFPEDGHTYAGLTVRQAPAEPEVAITVDTTRPESLRVYVVSTSDL